MPRLSPLIIRNLATTVLLLALGAFGAYFAAFTALPLPYLLGSLLITALVSIAWPTALPTGYEFPQSARLVFIALIGMVIGTQITPDLFNNPSRLLLSMGAIAVFVALAHSANFYILHRLGGYDRTTAFFCGAPGGLIEAITMGEAAGADIRALVIQHFLRIILVISLVPLGLSIALGHPVGSASGQSFAPVADTVTTINYAFIAAVLVLGIAIGRTIRLPAWQLTGPMIGAGALALAGYPLVIPLWLLNIAQLVVGTSLGMRFAGLNHRLLLRGLWLSALSVVVMLLIGAALAAMIYPFMGQPYDVLLITFAPGGINEMALVALSIGANPAFVTVHHIFRIFVTVIGLGIVTRRARQ